ncbi:MAG: acyl carrier protein [Actinomycetota bacterium]|nr:acyl carrier protein [Actinomycetota bacterium]
MPVPDLDVAMREAISPHLRVSPEELTLDFDLWSGGFDDDTAIGVLEAVEDLLDVRFPDDFLDGLTTYGQFSSAVRIAVGA